MMTYSKNSLKFFIRRKILSVKKLLLIFLILLACLKFSAFQCKAQNLRINYDLIYKDTPVLDFMYEDKLDPEEEIDYDKYVIISPYTLMRITDTLRSKKVLLKPGYYLVKAEKRDGYEFLLFKQNGKVAGVVPVYQKTIINPALIYKESLKPKPSLLGRIFSIPKKIISYPFKGWYEKRKVPLPPRSAIESRVVGNGKYLEIWLYVEQYLYKVLLKIEN